MKFSCRVVGGRMGWVQNVLFLTSYFGPYFLPVLGPKYKKYILTPTAHLPCLVHNTTWHTTKLHGYHHHHSDGYVTPCEPQGSSTTLLAEVFLSCRFFFRSLFTAVFTVVFSFTATTKKKRKDYEKEAAR